MAINSVSFGDSIQDLINKPQKYTAQPAAASKVQGDEFKKSHKGAKVLGGAVVLAGIAAAVLGGLAKAGKLPEGTIKTVGDKIAGYADKAVQWGKGIIENLKAKAPAAVEAAEEAASAI